MGSVALFFLSLFVLGLSRGAVICTTVCGPGLISYIVINKKTPRDALRLTFFFSIPRLLLLALLGGVVGFLTYKISSITGLTELSTNLHSAVYLIFGVILILIGFYLLAKSIDERSDFKEGVLSPTKKRQKPCRSYNKIKRKNILSRILDGNYTTSRWKENGAMMILGFTLGIGCLGEITLVEGTLLTTGAVFMDSALFGTILNGFLGMLIFSLGLTVPLVIVAMGASYLSSRIDTHKGLNIFKTVVSIIIMVTGTFIIIFNSGII